MGAFGFSQRHLLFGNQFGVSIPTIMEIHGLILLFDLDGTPTAGITSEATVIVFLRLAQQVAERHFTYGTVPMAGQHGPVFTRGT